MPARLPLILWLFAAVACALVVSRTQMRTDMAAFLPRSAAPAQQALMDQASNGAASHLVLLAIAGAPPVVLAALSRRLAAVLRAEPGFVDVANGDPYSFSADQDFIWRNRYLLSPGVTPARFTEPGLRAALENDLGLLSSDMGGLFEAGLPADPTGALLVLTSQLTSATGPRSLDGVWMSPSGTTALLLVHGDAAGFDIDAQQRALAEIASAFASARAGMPGAKDAQLRMTGPGEFAVRIRDTTKRDVTRLSMLATAGVAALLCFTYRSPRVLLLGLLPVASGALAAVAAVALAFGFVHGVTLGFGVTLIGESVDYAIYLFTQTAPGETPSATLARIWPTLRLGAATSVMGFGAMLFSNFTGFAQLGLFSITGLAAAVCVTRFVLPQLVPRGFFAPGSAALARPLLAVMAGRAWLRPLIAVLVLAGGANLFLHRGQLWNGNLNDLSPVPAPDQALYQSLRGDLGVPDQRYFAVFQAAGQEQALEASEALAPVLQNLVSRRALVGFDLPSAVLPSARTQSQRQAALPADVMLRARFAQASAGLPFRPGVFAPFFADVAAARSALPLGLARLPPALALRVQSMLVPSAGGWMVLAPLTGVSDPAGIAAAFRASALPSLQFVDVNHESAQLLRRFQHDATALAGIGSIAIIAVLLFGLRSPRRVAAVAAPLAAAVIVTAALLTLNGRTLSIFMVVGFLLIIAVGSNYCLFFERPQPDPAERRRALAAIALANFCTVAAYGMMSLSRIPVLHDIGMTVAIGTFLSLVFGAALTPRRPE